MLIRFTVENFLSFKDEVEFSMVAGRPRKHPDHIVRGERSRDIRLLKTGVIYGPNAAGKTNLIRSMDFAQNLIISGRRPKQHIGTIPFLLDGAKERKPSRFQFEIKCNEKYFAYGFEVDVERVHSEWLYEIRSSSERLIFEREVDSDGNRPIQHKNIKFDSKQEEEFYERTANSTRLNQLLLTETIERGMTYFEEIYDWFHQKLVLIYPESRPADDLGIRFLNNHDGFQEKLRDVLNLFDLGIDDVDVKRLDTDAEALLSELDKEKIAEFLDELPDDSDEKAVIYNPINHMFLFADKHGNYEAYRVVTVHEIKLENRKVEFAFYMESDGTRRLFELAPALIRLLSGGESVFVIDELDRQLHAHMTVNLLDIFLNNTANLPSQMIVTTHESGLLDLDLLRRDEIWFIEKDRHSASQVYSLEEFAPRYDVDVERSYLFGRYGAIPILPSYNVLEWAR